MQDSKTTNKDNIKPLEYYFDLIRRNYKTSNSKNIKNENKNAIN